MYIYKDFESCEGCSRGALTSLCRGVRRDTVNDRNHWRSLHPDRPTDRSPRPLSSVLLMNNYQRGQTATVINHTRSGTFMLAAAGETASHRPLCVTTWGPPSTLPAETQFAVTYRP